jgi:2-polyprenyl-3-methyl-5-hydroxy-6-metoxy-1,4-benzoquinol methylase
MTKKYFVEDRETWKKEYGTLFNHLPSIVLILRYIHKFIKLDEKPLRIVDYGCAYGYYLQVLKMINPKHDLFGVDTAKEAVEAATSVAGKDSVFWQSIGEPLPLENSSVDVIISFDVIEHVNDETEIVNFFEECNRLIKSLGYVFIGTPNCSFPMKVIFKMLGYEWIYKGKAHRNPFTVKKLKRLIEPYFKVVEISYKAGLYPSLKYTFLPTLRISPWFTFVLKKKMIPNRYP